MIRHCRQSRCGPVADTFFSTLGAVGEIRAATVRGLGRGAKKGIETRGVADGTVGVGIYITGGSVNWMGRSLPVDCDTTG